MTHLLELLGGPLEPLPPSRRHRSRFGPNWSAPAVEPTTTPAKRCCARGRRLARMPRGRARGGCASCQEVTPGASTVYVHKTGIWNNLLNGKRQTALLGWSNMTSMPAVVSNLSSGAFLPSVISQVSSRTRRHPRTHAHSNLHCIDRLRLHSFGWQGAVPVATAPTTPIAPTAPTAPIAPAMPPAPAVPPAPYDHAKRRTIVPIASTRAKGLEP